MACFLKDIESFINNDKTLIDFNNVYNNLSFTEKLNVVNDIAELAADNIIKSNNKLQKLKDVSKKFAHLILNLNDEQFALAINKFKKEIKKEHEFTDDGGYFKVSCLTIISKSFNEEIKKTRETITKKMLFIKIMNTEELKINSKKNK